MDYKELFESGMSYETFMSIATAREVEKMENMLKKSKTLIRDTNSFLVLNLGAHM